MLQLLGPLILAVAAVGAPPDQPSDTPRRVRGLIEPTTQETFSFANRAERKRRIDQVARQQDQLVAKLGIPVLLCPRVPEGAITLDGRLDEPAWRTAGVAENFRDTRSLKPSRSAAKAKLLWDSKFLYVAFEVLDSDIVATIDKPDGDFWREDTVEVFVDANSDAMSYLEFEVSPRKLLYDGSVADYRPEVDWIGDITHLAIERSARRYRVRDSKLGVQVAGTLNNDRDKDKGWTTELALSWADMARGENFATTSPVPVDGDQWRIGLYHINNRQHGEAGFAEYAAWSPTTTWFHAPRLFGRVVFVDAAK